ncbi:unnamed protein product, partial [Durusdinium trenchii]
ARQLREAGCSSRWPDKVVLYGWGTKFEDNADEERGLIGNWKVTRPRDLIFCGGGFASTTIHDLCRMLPETENG